MLHTTTNLKEVINNPSRFTWGEVLKIHSIGEYDIIEFHPHKFVNGFGTGEIDYDTKEYSCYINSKSLSESATSLDRALAICISRKYEGLNHHGAYYFMKMIGATE